METLGTKLKSAREKQKLTLEKASEQTKIRDHIIKALEDGNFSITSITGFFFAGSARAKVEKRTTKDRARFFMPERLSQNVSDRKRRLKLID